MTPDDTAAQRPGRRRGSGSPRGIHGTDRLLRPGLELALDVARGGLVADPPVLPPSGLQRVLTFARPSGGAWATVRRVVDADDAFRTRVADAADPDAVGRAPWLWLTRPEGWEAELAALAIDDERAAPADPAGEVTALRRRLAGAEQAARRHEERAVDARAAIDDLRTRLADQQPRLAELEQRVTELANDLEVATSERRDAIRNLKAAEADVADGRRRLRGEEKARREAEAALAELRQAVDRADEAADELPPPAPGPVEKPGPDLDALRTAVREAGAAAAALGRALDAAAGALPPADVVPAADVGAPAPSGSPPRPPRRPARRPTRLPGGVFEESVAAADHLLRLPEVIVVVDGYNVAKTAWTDVSLEEERRRLVQLLEQAHARTRAEFLVVFDGVGVAGAPPGQARSRTVRVRFSPAGVSADDVVRGLVDELPLDRPVVVVSSDREVIDGARARGANVIGSGQLLDAIR